MLGVTVVGGIALLIQMAINGSSGSQQPFSILGFEFTPIGALSVIAFVAFITAVLMVQGAARRRSEREFIRGVQARREKNREEG